MPSPRSIRLTFSINQKSIELERMRVVNMRSPAPDKVQNIAEDSLGCRVDVVDKCGEVLYSRRCQPFTPPFREAYTGDLAQPFALSRKQDTRDALSIVVPVIEGAYQVVLRETTADKASSKMSVGAPKPTVKDVCVIDLDVDELQSKEDN